MAKVSTTRVKTEALEIKVPQSREEAVEMLAELGRRQRERDRIQADMNDKLSEIRTAFEEKARPHNEKILELMQGVHTWAEANRGDLTQGGKVKTANLSSGDIGWRFSNPKIRIKGMDVVISTLKSLRLKRFIRVKEEVNKEAMLDEKELALKVPGVSIEQKELFWAKPFETELEEVTAG